MSFHTHNSTVPTDSCHKSLLTYHHYTPSQQTYIEQSRGRAKEKSPAIIHFSFSFFPEGYLRIIAKTGSLCCVAARPHESRSNRASGEWSLDLNDSHWRTNGSFSPPLSRRWDFRIRPDGGGGGGVPVLPRGQGYASYSSSSKGSRASRISSARHHYSVSDGVLSYASSPSESFNGQYWSPMPQGEFPTMPESRSGSSFQSSKEGFTVTGASAHHCSADSSSSYSDIGDGERNAVIHFPPVHKGFSGRYSFMSKPVYPMPFPAQFTEIDGPLVDSVPSSSRFTNSFRWPDNSVHHERKSSGSFPEFSYMQSFPEVIASSQRERVGWTTTNSPDSVWDTESSKYKNPLFGSGSSTSEGLKCGLCDRWLSQKSPWSSHRMIRCGDFPPSGVLSCGHVYHADCLEQTIPESQKHDPPCPLCAGALNTASIPNSDLPSSVSGVQAMSVSRCRIPRFKIATDDNSLNSSGKHSYVHSDYVADISGKKWHMQMPGCSKKSFLSRTLSRKHFFKGKSVKELPTEDLGSKKASSSMHVYHDNKSTDNIHASCSRG